MKKVPKQEKKQGVNGVHVMITYSSKRKSQSQSQKSVKSEKIIP